MVQNTHKSQVGGRQFYEEHLLQKIVPQIKKFHHIIKSHLCGQNKYQNSLNTSLFRMYLSYVSFVCLFRMSLSYVSFVCFFCVSFDICSRGVISLHTLRMPLVTYSYVSRHIHTKKTYERDIGKRHRKET